MKLSLHPGEYELKTYRQSEVTLTKHVLIIFVALYLPWFFSIRYDMVLQARNWLLLWTVVVFIYAIRTYMIWHLNRYVVTSERLICLAHTGVFRKTVIETTMERILNISYKTTGLASSLFKYGDVEVQVVGLMEPIILRRIKRPQEIKDYLWRLHQDQLKRQDNNYTNKSIARIQEDVGYTKKNQKVL